LIAPSFFLAYRVLPVVEHIASPNPVSQYNIIFREIIDRNIYVYIIKQRGCAIKGKILVNGEMGRTLKKAVGP
jgi:hypothetical protein